VLSNCKSLLNGFPNYKKLHNEKLQIGSYSIAIHHLEGLSSYKVLQKSLKEPGGGRSSLSGSPKLFPLPGGPKGSNLAPGGGG